MSRERKWVEFESSPAPRSGRNLYVSLNQHGIIVFNRKTYQELGEPEAVKLMFDIDNLSIGLKSCSLLMPNAFEVAQRGKSGTRLVWAKKFMVSHQIFTTGTFRFLKPEIEKGVLILDLNHIARTTQSPRTGWRKKK